MQIIHMENGSDKLFDQLSISEIDAIYHKLQSINISYCIRTYICI